MAAKNKKIPVKVTVKTAGKDLQNKIEKQRIDNVTIARKQESKEDNIYKAEKKFSKFNGFATAGFFIVNCEGIICELNHSGAAILNRNYSDLINSTFQLILDHDMESVFKSFLTNVFKSNSKEICQIKIETGNNCTIFIHIEGVVPVNEQECFMTVIDITDRKLAEDVHIENELRFSRALEATSDGLYDMDVNTNTAYCNPRYYSMLGYDHYELPPTTETWLSLMHPDDLERASQGLFKQISQKCEFLEQEYRQKHKNGSWIWILDRSRIMEYDKSGNPARIVGTHIDITERKLADNEIQRLLHEKEILLIEVNHRIKNNMLSMQLLLQTQSIRNENPEIKTILLDASNRLKSMAVLYDKLYQSRNITESSAREYLPVLISEIVKAFPRIDSLKIETDIEDIVLHEKILSPLGIIINELLSNSMKYAFEGCIECRISVKLFKKENRVTVIYEDNGIGTPESVTFENTTGFGMQLIVMLTEDIGGDIRIERGNGSKFILEFEI